MANDTPFPERWLAERKTAQPGSETLAAIKSFLTEDGLDELRLLARLKTLSAGTNSRQEQ